jgi:ABC-type sugar transport system permease subunit
MTSQEEDWSVFFYIPSLPAAIVFAALYIIPFAYHLYISFVAYRHGKYFCYSYSVPLLLAAIVEIHSYSQRVASTQSVQDIGTFATSQMMIVLAPVLVCASLYILLSRIILSTHPEDANEEITRVLCGALKVT